jgi:hypothetical protein
LARTFGARFLEEFQQAGGSTANWSPQAFEAMKNADRRTFTAALAKASSAIGRELTIAAHTAEPDILARRAVALMKKAEPASADLWPLLFLSM